MLCYAMLCCEGFLSMWYKSRSRRSLHLSLRRHSSLSPTSSLFLTSSPHLPSSPPPSPSSPPSSLPPYPPYPCLFLPIPIPISFPTVLLSIKCLPCGCLQHIPLSSPVPHGVKICWTDWHTFKVRGERIRDESSGEEEYSVKGEGLGGRREREERRGGRGNVSVVVGRRGEDMRAV